MLVGPNKIDVCWCPLLSCDLFSHATEQVSLAVTCLSRRVFSVRTTDETRAILKGISGGLLESNLIRPPGAGMSQAVWWLRYRLDGSGFESRQRQELFLRFSQNCEKRLLASPCLSVRMEQLGPHWTNFHEILYLRIFLKCVLEIQFWLKVRQE